MCLESKRLRSIIKNAKKNINELNNEIYEKKLLIKFETNKMKKAEKDLQHQLGSDVLEITEHAMLRFIERVLGIDIVELKNKIVLEDRMAEMVKLGNGTFPMGDHRIVLKDRKVVTVLNSVK